MVGGARRPFRESPDGRAGRALRGAPTRRVAVAPAVVVTVASRLCPDMPKRGVVEDSGRKKWDAEEYERKILAGEIGDQARRPVSTYMNVCRVAMSCGADA